MEGSSQISSSVLEKQQSLPNQIQSLNSAGQAQQKHYYFQTQTKRLKKYYLEQKKSQGQSKIVNRRILFNNSIGTVKYFGPLRHQGADQNQQELWIGVEWDEKDRGKHNGTVKGYQYFKCTQGQGSMVKFEKIQFGYSFQSALFRRYFKSEEMHHAKNIYEELKMQKKLKQQEQKLEPMKPTQKSQNQDKNEQTQSENSQKQQIKPMQKKVHKVQYDSDSYFSTQKDKKKIMVEFIGFDQIWTKINNVDKIQSISLSDCRICDLGPKGHLGDLLSNLKILSLEDNLLSDYNQIYQLGTQLPQLSELSLTNNILAEPQKAFQQLSQVQVVGHKNQRISFQERNFAFPKLKTLILINTGLKWRILFKILKAFNQLSELFLCKNEMTDFENFDQGKISCFDELKSLNLQDTGLKDYKQVHRFKDLPKLEKLVLNKNPISEFGRQNAGFAALKSLSVQNTGIQKAVILFQLSQNFKNVQILNLKHSPINKLMGNSYVRLRSIAQFQKLNIINGSPLIKYQRKDSEIFYLRESFREYFALKNKLDYDYDYEDFLKWCQEFHPNIKMLIKRYGNPYEVEEKKEIKQLVKKEVKQTQIKKGTGMIGVQIQIAETGQTFSKKIPLSWTLTNLKNLFSKTYKIPAGNQQLIHQNKQQEIDQEMTEDHKPLNYYNLCSTSLIIVKRTE